MLMAYRPVRRTGQAARRPGPVGGVPAWPWPTGRGRWCARWRCGSSRRTGRWVQLGDTYSGKPNAIAAAPYKSLLLLPERYRVACVDQIGLTAGW